MKASFLKDDFPRSRSKLKLYCINEIERLSSIDSKEVHLTYDSTRYTFSENSSVGQVGN